MTTSTELLTLRREDSLPLSFPASCCMCPPVMGDVSLNVLALETYVSSVTVLGPGPLGMFSQKLCSHEKHHGTIKAVRGGVLVLLGLCLSALWQQSASPCHWDTALQTPSGQGIRGPHQTESLPVPWSWTWEPSELEKCDVFSMISQIASNWCM